MEAMVFIPEASPKQGPEPVRFTALSRVFDDSLSFDKRQKAWRQVLGFLQQLEHEAQAAAAR